ncbi:MAG: hypothetical protein ABIX28_13730 [Vicinamibacterales bacterium]
MTDQNRRSDDSSAQSQEENAAQRNSDAPPDVIAAREISPIASSDGDMSRGSDTDGAPAFDEVEGEERRKLYDKGVTLVSKI